MLLCAHASTRYDTFDRLAADKGMKKVSTFPKKVSQNHQPTIVPQQGIQGEKTSVFEKPVTMEKVKFRSPDRVKEDRALSLPEVKGATDGGSHFIKLFETV